ncbi:MAG: AIR synthase family protein [Candidatus Caldarchaeum sp.]|nr:AIR synthase family protein [Candidatus Caldarchaeum sp.]
MLPVGKLPEKVLKNIVLRRVGAFRKDVVVWPGFGEDAGAVKTFRDVYVFSMDPITGSKSFIGWLAVHASANDVAVSGGRPEWFSSTILLPKGTGPADLKKIVSQIHRACKKLGVAVVTGHSEVAPFVSSPVVVGHMMGRLLASKPIKSAGARPGDQILMVKSVALEGAAIIATDFAEVLKAKGFSVRELVRASSFIRKTSVVDEALTLAKTGVHSMHDPTEGGLVGGLYEMAQAAGVGFKVERSKVLVHPLVEKICGTLEIDPLRLISSGTLLATAPQFDQAIVKKLGGRIIGKIVPRRHGMKIVGDDVERVKGPVQDELWRLFSSS